ncbi:MAG: hypothetical protein J5616_03390 [Bacteroidaceae bacterium]|nr:hypothetical protein [Bacteroidaceae bacterium]
MEKSVSFLRLCSMLLMLVCFACGEHRTSVVLADDEGFREGDLVLRCGYGAESQVVTEASQSAYSHIGILHHDSLADEWMVIHAVPGEAERGEPEYVKCEPLAHFYAADRAVSGAWMRVNCADSIAGAASRYAWSKAKAQVEFDNDYQLSDTTQLYCTELIWQAYLHQGIDLSDGHRHSVPTLVCKDGECIFPSDIAESTNILYVKPFNTQEQ